MADQPEKEIRFAVVMYGGVSLAIYINGVTQELMNMVRATARSRENDGQYHVQQVEGVEKVYRDLGRELGARFVVDILSGTSAGGINAVYLGKALANDQKIDKLKDMWIEQGDIERLINDKASVEGLVGLLPANKPSSLLNSQRMYYQLLSALQDMKPKNGSSQSGASPYVEELDLFITATDLQGPAIPIRNGDGPLPRERRFRNVFHFHYATPWAAGNDDDEIVNDFQEKYDPFLAFAARCTSSFPFAFEPMRLKDIETLLGNQPFKDYSYARKDWARFYRDYDSESFPAQFFGDGGYLDNKPFSYATSTLNRRRADLPVDRKLVYIEPAPERIPEVKPGEPKPPDAIANVMLALLTLPRYETIREDLQAISGRNEIIAAVNDIVQNIEDIYTLHRESLVDWNPSDPQKPMPPWRSQFLNDMVRTYGVGYLPYHQLRVRDVLANLLELNVRRMGWREDGPQAKHLSTVLEAWRHIYYKTSMNETDDIGNLRRKSENDLLFRLDTTWYIRRLHYLRGLIDALLNDLANGKFAKPGSRSKSILDHSQADWPDVENKSEEYRLALLWLKQGLNDVYVAFRGKGRALRSRSPAQGSNLSPKRKEYDDCIEELKVFFESEWQGESTKITQLEKLAEFAGREAANVPLETGELAAYLQGLQRIEDSTAILTSDDGGPIYEILTQASADIHKTLKVQPTAAPENKLSQSTIDVLPPIQKCLAFYDSRFEYFDMLTFPITYGTSVGESDAVEVIRISPEDAVEILGEGNGDKKLQGTKLGNFGAFFNPQWRENDMLWGRLDGAECLINAVCPPEMDPKARKKYIAEAQTAILEEFFLPRDQLTTFQARYELKSVGGQELQEALERLTGSRDQLIENFKQSYRPDPEFPAESTLKAASRASSVLGQLMAGLADQYPQLNQPAGIFSRLGQVFFALISVALPGSLSSSVFNTLIRWIYIVEVFLIGLGRVLVGLDNPNRGIDFTAFGGGIATLAAEAFLVTLLAHLVVATLRNVFSRRWNFSKAVHVVRDVVFSVLGLGIAILLFLGFLYLGAFPSVDETVRSLLNALK